MLLLVLICHQGWGPGLRYGKSAEIQCSSRECGVARLLAAPLLTDMQHDIPGWGFRENSTSRLCWVMLKSPFSLVSPGSVPPAVTKRIRLSLISALALHFRVFFPPMCYPSIRNLLIIKSFYLFWETVLSCIREQIPKASVSWWALWGDRWQVSGMFGWDCRCYTLSDPWSFE